MGEIKICPNCKLECNLLIDCRTCNRTACNRCFKFHETKVMKSYLEAEVRIPIQ